MKTRSPGWLVLLLLSAATLPAVELDEELQEALATARRMKETGHAIAGEQVLEEMTRVRRHDPRTWYALGNFRVAMGAKQEAVYPYHRAAGLGSERMRDALRARLREAGLPLFEDPITHEDFDEFRILATTLECFQRRFAYGSKLKTCPVAGKAFTEGGRTCPDHPDMRRPDPGTLRCSGAVLAKALGAPEPWLRAWAVKTAEHRFLAGKALEPLLSERDPVVRKALLERFYGRAATMEKDGWARRVLREYTLDADFEIRRDAWTLLHLTGETPTPGDADFHELVRQADRGLASPHMVRAIFRTRPDGLRATLQAVLDEPRFGGKQKAIELLVRHGGREGQLAVARRFAEHPDASLAEEKATAVHAMRWLAAHEGLELGETPEEWVAALEKAP